MKQLRKIRLGCRLRIGLAFLLAVFVMTTATARAQIQTQPTEIITASPLTPFSERAGAWPVLVIPADVTPGESEPLGYFLNTIPSVQARENGSPTISIRGSAEAARALTLFDGTPLNFADGFGAPRLLIPDEILGDLRLLKGPASVFYGPYAMAGALHFMPRVFDQPAVRLSAAEDKGHLASATALGVLPFRWGNDALNFVQLSAYTENEPGDFSFESVTSPVKGRRTNNNTSTQRYSLIGRQTSGRWTFRERAVVAQGIGSTPGPVTTPYVSRFNTWAALGSADASARLSQKSDANLRITSLWQDASYDRGSASESRMISTKNAASLDYGYTFDGLIVSRTFVDLIHDQFELQNRQPTGSLAGPLFVDDSFELGQVFEIPLHETWMLQPGARWLARYGEILSSLGLIRDRDHDRLWLTYSEGFRAPSLIDLYSDTTFYLGNPALKPENSKQIEFGYLAKPLHQQSTFMEGFSWGTSVYAIQYDRVFDYEPITPTQKTRINRGEAFSYGAELSAGLSRDFWTLSTAYSHLQGENRTTNEPLPLAPRHQLTVSGTLHLGPMVFELKETYWSSFYDRDFATGTLKKLPSWSVFDIGLRSIGFTAWEFKAGVLNVFDEPRELTLGYPEPQRSFYLSVLRHL